MTTLTPRVLLSISLASLIVVTAYAALGGPEPVTSPVPSSFTVNGKTFTFTYTATDEAQREVGLMNRKVTNTTTMLFVFPSPGTYLFWMYNTNASLDIIWINATGTTGRVVFVFSGAPPCYDSLTCPRYGPTAPANYVIEAKAGFVLANGIEVGTAVGFS